MDDIDVLFTATTLTTMQNAYDTEATNIKNAVAAVTAGNVQDMMKQLYEIWFDAMIAMSKVSSGITYASDAQKFAKNCFVLPIAKGNIGGSQETVWLGKFESNAKGNKGFGRIVYDSATVSIPWQATQRAIS